MECIKLLTIKGLLAKVVGLTRKNSVDVIVKFYLKLFRFSSRVIFFLIKRNSFLSHKLIDLNKRKSVRVYLKKDIGLEDFFERIANENVRYVVLRWFDSLPNIKHGEDVDMLVDSQSLPIIMKYFTHFPLAGHQKFDLYPSGYDSEMNYNNLSYYPENLAHEILDNSVVLNGKYNIPNKHYHILSLLFHILFHKAERSSFILDGICKKVSPEHSYPQIIKEISGIEFRSLGDIFDYLLENSFLPSIDTMKKYAAIAKSKGLLDIVCQHEKVWLDGDDWAGESVMFVVRESLAKYPFLEKKLDHAIRSQGYEIISIIDEVPKSFSLLARGNNWGKGPYAVSGGEACRLIVAHNQRPDYMINADGFSQDKKIVFVKNFIRNATAIRLPFWKQFNGLHTTDNTAETLEYAQYISHEFMSEILIKIKKSEARDKIKDSFKVIESLTAYGRRANVYKVYYQDKISVLKIYKPEFNNYFSNEVSFYKKANANSLPVPELLEVGDGYFVTDFIEGNTVRFGLKSILKANYRLDRAYKKFVLLCHKINYFNSDFVFSNNIITSEGKVFFYDFEFMQEYIEFSSEPYELSGIPDNCMGSYLIPLAYKENLLKSMLYMKIRSLLPYKEVG